jgi:hypothetical protein
MSRLTISDLSGGVVDAVDGQKIPDNCLVEAVNYEYVNGTELVRRKNIGLSIDLHIPNLRSFSVWYPTNNLIDNIDKHICIADNGQTISLYYRTNETGYHAVISLFSDVGDNVSYFVSADRVLIADGLNRCRYVSINIDGEVASGTLGIPSPTNKVQISIEENDNRYVIVNPAEGLPNNDIGMGRERGNILGVCYTVEDEIGNESNPSPVNYEQRLMYKYPTADTDIGYQYFWAKATYKGLKIPVVSDTVVSDTVVERLKYYNIYVTDTDYTSGTYGKSFVLVARVRIVSPDGQTYSDTSKEKLKSIDYTNNPSPVASTVIESNNVIFVGNIKDKINFPFEFDSYTAITINNQNDRDYVNAVIAISIKGSDVGIESFSDIDTHKKRYRIFASDRITPINVIYKNVGYTELRCYLRIPMLNRGVNTIYFCYYAGEGKVALKPSIIVTETLETFYALEDGYSAVQNYTVEGYALSATSYIVIVPPVKFEISANGTTDWKTSTDSLEVAPSGAVTVYVRFAPTEVGDVTGHINHSNITSGCLDVDMDVDGSCVDLPHQADVLFQLENTDFVTMHDTEKVETWKTKIPASPNQETFAGRVSTGWGEPSDTWLPIVTTDSADALAGFPTLRFGGLTYDTEHIGFRGLSTSTVDVIDNQTGFTIAVLVRLETNTLLPSAEGNGWGEIINIQQTVVHDNNVAPLLCLEYGTSADYAHIIMRTLNTSASSHGVAVKYFDCSDLRDGEWHLIVGLLNTAYSTGNASMTVYVDGVSLGEQVFAIYNSLIKTHGIAFVGHYDNPFSFIPYNGFEGIMAAAYAWHELLTTAEIAQITDYIKSKYGVTF